MTPEIIYLLKVNIAFILFYGFYRLFFHKDTFFRLRRMILSAFFGVAPLYPFFNFQDWLKAQEPIEGVIVFYHTIVPPALPAAVEKSDPLSIADIARFIYLGVSLLLLCRFFVQLLSILQIKRESRPMLVEGTKIQALNKPGGPFSFFTWIFIYLPALSEKETREILTHELTHVRQVHSIDVILSELFCIFFWINPFIWLLKREVRYNLEYLADDKVVHSGCDSKSYQYHLLGLASNQAAANLYTNFNVLHLKNRISMMNKRRSRGILRVKYLIFLPLIALLLLLSNIESVARVANRIVVDLSFREISQQKVDRAPQYPGGEQALMNYLQKNIKYPSSAVAQELQGLAVAIYTLSADGSVTDVKMKTSIDPLLDNEVMRVIKGMPKWTPAQYQGKAVATVRTLPVLFKLQGAGKNPDQEKVEENCIIVVGYAQQKEEAGEEKIYKDTEVMPVFPGGELQLMKYVQTHLKYPPESANKGIEGRVIIRFVVRKNGSLSNIGVLRSLDPLCDAEAVRVVKNMPRWKPGMQNGKTVPVYFTLPVVYRLTGAQKAETK